MLLTVSCSGGGVLIAVKIKYVGRVLSVPINNIEQLLVTVSVGNERLVLDVAFIPPNSCIEIYDSHIGTVELFLFKHICIYAP